MKREKFFQKTKDKCAEILQALLFHQQQDIIVFSHLRWDFIFQRPQHVVTQLAKKNRILFIEEPIPFHPMDRGKTTLFSPQKNITVLQPKIAHEFIKQELPLVIAKQIRLQKMHNPILWFYSGLFGDLVSLLNHSLIIYDYMNKERILENTQETYLFSVADIIFVSEKYFFEKNKAQISNLHYLPQSFILQDKVGIDIQKIMLKAIEVKSQTVLRTRPFYHPFIPQLTVGNKRSY